MNRPQQISLLKKWNVEIPSGANKKTLDDLIESHRKESREVKSRNSTIKVVFDKADDDGPVEIQIYEDIGNDPFGFSTGFTAKDFMDAVKDIDPMRPLDLRINSAGGDVQEGKAIKTRMDEWKGKKTASIDGQAASVASWLPMSFDEIRAPKHAEIFIHDAWAFVAGNSDDLSRAADMLDKESGIIAQMYADRTGMSQSECRDMMKSQTLMTADEALEMGFIDKITDGDAVSNFSEIQLKNMSGKLLAFANSKKQGDMKTLNKKKTLNKDEKIALLKKWGVAVPENASERWINSSLALGNPQNKVKFKNGKDGDHDDDCDCADCMSSKNAPEPDAPEETEADDPEHAEEEELWKASTENRLKKNEKVLNQMILKQRRDLYQGQLDGLVQNGILTTVEAKNWMPQILAATENDAGENPILENLKKQEPRKQNWREPVSIEVGDPNDIGDIDRAFKNLLPDGIYRNCARGKNSMAALRDRMAIAENSREVARLINRLKKYDGPMPKGLNGKLPNLSPDCPLVVNWERMRAQNANTMSSGLLRQVILSEAMRAFRRQFVSLEIFCHNFGIVALEGTDVVDVPYYPLATTASTEFLYSNGYVVAANAKTQTKSVTVGGVGNGVASAGSGRKYQTLQFQGYEIRRYPWLDVQKLSVMAGEQLAIDVRADIIGTQICQANFGNAIWTGAANGFDHTVVGNVLLQSAIAGFWPLKNRNVVLSPGYYTNLAIDPAITPLLAIGTTDILREGIVGGLYGFENIIHDPLIPISTYIQGGSGNTVNGLDLYLQGFMAFPSAVLIATAPIMPPPGVLHKLVAYEQITDDQTGLAFTYQFLGNELSNVDQEIIECTYGSGPGELAALYRLTSQGN